MKYTIAKVWLSTLVLLIPRMQLFAGDIIGKVTIVGVAETTVQPSSPYARSRFTEISRGGNTNLNEVVVFLAEHPNLPSTAVPESMPVMDQRNMAIVPHVLAVQAGTTVEFPNSDDLYHNLFSLSKVKKFDLGRYRKGLSKQVTFDEVGIVRVYCDIHPSMSGVVVVLPNQYFTFADGEGNFSLSDVPEGKYELHVWHENHHDAIYPIGVQAIGELKLEVKLGERQ
ncbi:hypothetical protein ACFLQV_03690 [Calditrichota bacterium]